MMWTITLLSINKSILYMGWESGIKPKTITRMDLWPWWDLSKNFSSFLCR